MSVKPSPAEILDMLVAKGPALRKAGVTELELEGFKVKLSAHVDEGDPDETPATEPEAPRSAFDDPATFGLPPDSAVPGFAALRDRDRRAKGDDQ